MRDAVRHRGPDDEGEWVDLSAGVALGHRRLSIVDLSAAGHQPMMSPSGRFVLVFNGEIYNHLELRESLADSWRGHSDTETLLAGIESWGLEATLRRVVGMFALAVWDRSTRSLSLARDRMGEKPLYYGRQGRSFLFGSELKALREHPEFRGEIDRAALAAYVRSGYVRAPRSIYAGISKLPPGTILTIKDRNADAVSPTPVKYWDLAAVIAARAEQPFKGTADAAVAELESRMLASVKGQQLADVPLGAFLSGGVDSSTVVALMQATASRPVKTFSIGFEERAYNEATHARAVANHLRTEHTELYVSADDALNVIPDLPTIYDEPFADPSQIPTVLLSRLTREHVTVALSGDGGDELFCGYLRYPNTARTWARIDRIPRPARAVLGRVAPSRVAKEAFSAARDVDAFYEFTNAQWKGHPQLVSSQPPPPTIAAPPAIISDARERMMYSDACDYLPDDILVKVDRAAMASSLETRVPLLDHRIVEFAWQLPLDMKFREGVGKWPVKEILHRYVPREIVDRPKMGFGVPIEHWLRGPLRGWAQDLLSATRLKSDGFFDPAAVAAEWSMHSSGRRDRHYGLWTVLMFQAWLASQQRSTSTAVLP